MSGSSGAGGAGTLGESHPNEEVTIARPLKRAGPIQFTFRHRTMWTVDNQRIVESAQRGVSGKGTDLVFYRPPFNVFALKAAMFWMTLVEFALMDQFRV